MGFNSSFFFVLLLSLAIVLATTIHTESSYAAGAVVKITGTCNAVSVPVAVQATLQGNPIAEVIDQTEADAAKNYQYTFTPQGTGTYTVFTACHGETAATTTFTVGVSGGGSSSSSSSGSSGGGGGCTSSWDCKPWTVCNASLQQSRVCVDLKKCNYKQLEKVENRSCKPCKESWICSEWSECDAGVQSRNCYDERDCGTVSGKPVEEKACDEVVVAGPVPAKVSSSYTPPATGGKTGAVPSSTEAAEKATFFQENMIYIILGVVGLLVLVGLVFSMVYLLRKKKIVYNVEELQQWILKERAAGEKDEDIKKILIEHTGWTEQEVEATFQGLKSFKPSLGKDVR